MSDTPSPMPAAVGRTARPASLVTIVFVAVIFAAAFLLVRFYHRPATLAPENAAAENLPPELAWRATAAARRAALQELRTAEQKRAASYAWIDQGAGVVRLPLDRAMELTVEKYGAKK